MKELLQINETNKDELERYSQSLADTYRQAFSGSPWFERSRCDNSVCDVAFCGAEVGTACLSCSQILIPAYDDEVLIDSWKQTLAEDGMIQLTLDGELPVCATITRPTTPQELYVRKYSEVPQMEEWLDQNTPRESVWIEDTFANREIVPTGNLRNRRQVLANIALRYSGLSVATRTLAVPVIAATARDAAGYTDMFLGSEKVGDQWAGVMRSVGSVPDRRTFLQIDAGELL